MSLSSRSDANNLSSPSPTDTRPENAKLDRFVYSKTEMDDFDAIATPTGGYRRQSNRFEKEPDSDKIVIEY